MDKRASIEKIVDKAVHELVERYLRTKGFKEIVRGVVEERAKVVVDEFLEKHSSKIEQKVKEIALRELEGLENYIRISLYDRLRTQMVKKVLDIVEQDEIARMIDEQTKKVLAKMRKKPA